MADVHTKAQRSYNMSRIKGKDTKPEMLVRRYLHAQGYRFRLHVKDLPGKPDIVLPKYKTAIFVHGCFWHGHFGHPCYVIPKTRTDWWIRKIEANKGRDTRAFRALKRQGWKVIEIWECQLKKVKRERSFNKLENKLTS